MTKTIKQLIEILSKFDPELPIYFDYDHGYQQYEVENISANQITLLDMSDYPKPEDL